MYKISILLLLTTCCYGQAVLKVTEQENDKLAKLKAQNESLLSEIQKIDIQIQALTILKQMTEEHQKQKLSELKGTAEDIKKLHQWTGKNITYNEQQGESGSFVQSKEPLPPPPVMGDPK